MEISNNELRELLKDARNTGFLIAFVACFCLFILGGIFTLYVYKSFEPSISSISQVQDGENNIQELNNEANTKNSN